MLVYLSLFHVFVTKNKQTNNQPVKESKQATAYGFKIIIIKRSFYSVGGNAHLSSTNYVGGIRVNPSVRTNTCTSTTSTQESMSLASSVHRAVEVNKGIGFPAK